MQAPGFTLARGRAGRLRGGECILLPSLTPKNQTARSSYPKAPVPQQPKPCQQPHGHRWAGSALRAWLCQLCLDKGPSNTGSSGCQGHMVGGMGR